MFGILKLNNGYGMLLRALLLAVVMSFMAVGAAEAQEKKPRKKLKQLLCIADSLRKELRKSADRGQMLQWGDSIFMAELDKSRMSEKKKLRIMKHYSKIQRRLSFYDRKLFCGDSILAAKYKKIKFDTNYISRPDARWTISNIGMGNINNRTLRYRPAAIPRASARHRAGKRSKSHSHRSGATSGRPHLSGADTAVRRAAEPPHPHKVG